PMLGDYASSCGSWSLYSATGNIPMALSEAIIATYMTIHMARSPGSHVGELRLLARSSGKERKSCGCGFHATEAGVRFVRRAYPPGCLEAKAEEFSAFERTAGPAVRATGTKRPDRSCGCWLGLGDWGMGEIFHFALMRRRVRHGALTMRLRSHVRSAVKTASWRAFAAAVAALIDNGASQPQKIRPGQAEPGRSGAVRSTREGKLDGSRGEADMPGWRE